MSQPEVRGEVAREVHRVVAPAVIGAGLHLDGVRIVGTGPTQSVRITVDLPETEIGSLGTEQLDRVSRAISQALDADDVVPGTYTLEVSSPGATRPLHTPRAFRRARTRLVRLTLTDGEELTGRLIAVSDDDDAAVLTLDISGKERKVPLSEVKVGKVELEMSRVETAEFDDDDAFPAHGDEA